MSNGHFSWAVFWVWSGFFLVPYAVALVWRVARQWRGQEHLPLPPWWDLPVFLVGWELVCFGRATSNSADKWVAQVIGFAIIVPLFLLRRRWRRARYRGDAHSSDVRRARRDADRW